MKIDLTFTLLQREISVIVDKLMLAESSNIATNDHLDREIKDFKKLKYSFEKRLEEDFPLSISHNLWQVLNPDQRETFDFSTTFEEHKNNFTIGVKEYINNLNSLISLIAISDPLINERSYKEDRADLSVQEKKDLLLKKLYDLKKTNRFWSASLIFYLNDVYLDNEDEASQIAYELKTSGYVELSGYMFSSPCKITVKGKAIIEKNSKHLKQNKLRNTEMIDIFISHSSQDSEIAKLLIDLIRTALSIPDSKIRCTSVDGYRLPGGATTNEQLKKEVHDCKVLIGIISTNSINSAYVLFELGARWGISKPLIPLVTTATGVELLKGPLNGINALNATITAQLYQLIEDLARYLYVKSGSPAAYAEKLNIVVKHTLENVLPTELPSAPKDKSNQLPNNGNQADRIKSYCKKQWPDDFQMQVHCISEQNKASTLLEKPHPTDIPEDIYNKIMQKCKTDWAEDLTMQVHSRNEQIDAYRLLHNS